MLLFAIHVCYAWLIWFNVFLSKLLPYWMILLCWILQIMFTMRTMDIIDSLNIEPMLLLTMRIMTWLILDQCHSWYCEVLSIVKCLPFHLELVIKRISLLRSSPLNIVAYCPILWLALQYCCHESVSSYFSKVSLVRFCAVLCSWKSLTSIDCASQRFSRNAVLSFQSIRPNLKNIHLCIVHIIFF